MPLHTLTECRGKAIFTTRGMQKIKQCFIYKDEPKHMRDNIYSSSLDEFISFKAKEIAHLLKGTRKIAVNIYIPKNKTIFPLPFNGIWFNERVSYLGHNDYILDSSRTDDHERLSVIFTRDDIAFESNFISYQINTKENFQFENVEQNNGWWTPRKGKISNGKATITTANHNFYKNLTG